MPISSSNSFRNASDTKVLNTIRQANHYPTEMVAEAQEVAVDRGLINTKETAVNISNRTAIKELAKQQLTDGTGEIKVIQELQQKGFTKSEAESIVLQAQNERLYGNSGPIQYPVQESSGIRGWHIFLIGLIVIRLIRCGIAMSS